MEGEPKMPDPTPDKLNEALRGIDRETSKYELENNLVSNASENEINQELKDIEKATLEDGLGTKQNGSESAPESIKIPPKPTVPDYGLGEYNAPIAEAIQNVKNIQEKNQKSADEIAGMLGQVLRSVPPEKSQQIFREVYADILKGQRQPPTPQKRKIQPVSQEDEFTKFTKSLNEESDFSKNQKKCLDYLDQLAEKGRFFPELRRNIKEGQEFDVTQTLKYYERYGLTQEEAYTLSKLFGI
jgi:hypothetical protein